MLYDNMMKTNIFFFHVKNRETLTTPNSPPNPCPGDAIYGRFVHICEILAYHRLLK